MEFIRGLKLSLLPPDEIRRLVKVGQDAFLTQLLEIGFFHSDPHPGQYSNLTHALSGKHCAWIEELTLNPHVEFIKFGALT